MNREKLIDEIKDIILLHDGVNSGDGFIEAQTLYILNKAKEELEKPDRLDIVSKAFKRKLDQLDSMKERKDISLKIINNNWNRYNNGKACLISIANDYCGFIISK